MNSNTENNLLSFFDNHRYILAPMAGVNDVVFRQLCLRGGADLTYTEMISSMGLHYANNKTRDMLELAPNEENVVVQLFGHDPNTMASQALEVEEKLGTHLAYIDINMGCPAPKIVKKGDGAALMHDPNLAAKIVSKCCRVCSAPITVKFRRGYEQGDETAVDFALRMQEAGAAAVCVHGRYAMQYYKGSADWNVVSRVVDAVGIPVIGSGDIVEKKSADTAFNTGISAVMIGRAARGNPYIFDICKGLRDSVHARKIINTGKQHVTLFAVQSPKLLKHMRKHCIWYTKGLNGAVAARKLFCEAESLQDFIDVFNKLLEVN